MRVGKLLLAVVFCSYCVMVNGQPKQAAIASAHPLATKAGIEILSQGGNAFDAAVTVAAVLAVVEPYGSGLGGGGFWLLHQAEAKINESQDIVIDARERAPHKAHKDLYLQNDKVNSALATQGVMAAAIPGEAAGIVYLAKNYGKLPLTTTLKPAIEIAKNGFELDAAFAKMLKWRHKTLAKFPSTKQLLFKDDHPLQEGDTLLQPELAKVLEIIAAEGHDGFYKTIAKDLVLKVQQAGGIWSEADFNRYQVIKRKPLVGKYKDINIVTMPPPSAGGIAILNTFNILSEYELSPLTKADKIHLVVESLRLAYCDRAKYLGDPDFVNVPTTMLISEQHAEQSRKLIDINRAGVSKELNCGSIDETGEHTTHYSIIDKWGNKVAATLTVNLPFGSGYVVPELGIILNNEMDDFAISTKVPNSFGLVGHKANLIQPYKTPLSSMSPTFFSTEHVEGIIGTPGGSRIPTMILLSLLAYADGATPAEMLSIGRYHHQYMPDAISYEPQAIASNEINALRVRGHQLEPMSRQYGNMQLVMWDKQNQVVFAGSDPRGVGLAQVLD